MHVKSFLPPILGSVLLFRPAMSCPDSSISQMDFASIASRNNLYQSRSLSNGTSSTKIAIDNVRVFDGYKLGPVTTVVIDGTAIGEDATGAKHIDAKGATLLPGLIDAHCHPSNVTHLEELSRFGVTTGFTMACFSAELCKSLQNHTGLTNVLRTSAPASAPGSAHGNITARVDPSLLIYNDSQVPAWMKQQLDSNPDYVRLVAEVPGLSQKTLSDLTSTAHQGGKLVVTHASSYEAYEQVIRAGVDHVQHAPLDQAVSKDIISRMLQRGQTVTPTLTMMKASADNNPAKYNFTPAMESVTTLHKAGIPILAGTDANTQSGVPATVPFGSSIHDELEYLVEAGMSNSEALRAATSLPALYYGLHDRGAIIPGMRADLILVDGDPLENITATRRIQKVWIAGVEYSGA